MTQTDKTAQPTPGPTLEPWNLAEAEDTFRVIRSEGRLIAKVFTMFPDGAPNARLIAAAPRMLGFIRDVARMGDDGKCACDDSTCFVCEASRLLRVVEGTE